MQSNTSVTATRQLQQHVSLWNLGTSRVWSRLTDVLLWSRLTCCCGVHSQISQPSPTAIFSQPTFVSNIWMVSFRKRNEFHQFQEITGFTPILLENRTRFPRIRTEICCPNKHSPWGNCSWGPQRTLWGPQRTFYLDCSLRSVQIEGSLRKVLWGKKSPATSIRQEESR